MIHPSPDNTGIVWLASYPKSGNTWLRVFLYHLLRIANGAPREDDEINKLDRASTYEALLTELFAEVLGKPVDKALFDEVAAARPKVHAMMAERVPHVALIKTHNCVADVRGVPLVNFAVTAGVVYMVRDPRDVAVSLAHHLGVDVDQAIDVMGTSGFMTPTKRDGVFEVWGSWSEHVASWTDSPQDAVLVVRYEDLTADPVGKFTEITAHLGQNPSAEAIAEATELATFDKLAAAEQVTRFRETSEMADRFFREGKAGAWRQKLTGIQARRIASGHGVEMQRWGYDPD